MNALEVQAEENCKIMRTIKSNLPCSAALLGFERTKIQNVSAQARLYWNFDD
jgi:hypothetical protein